MTQAIRRVPPLPKAPKPLKPPARDRARAGRARSTIGVGAEMHEKQLSLRELQDAWGGCGRLPLSYSLRVLLLVMSELEKLHALGQVHGELTPEHVVLAEQGTVYLAPPGRAPPHPRDTRRRHHFRYFAPEKLQQRAVDARADVFSVGVLLWEALAGMPLLDVSKPEEILARWRTGGAPLAPVRSPLSLARSLSHIAARALAIEPEDRCASVQQLHAAVDVLGGGHAAKLDAWSALLRRPLPPKLAKSSRPPELAPATLTRAELELHPVRDPSFSGSGRWGNDTIFDWKAGPPDSEFDAAMPHSDQNFRLDSQAPPPDDNLPTRFMLAPGRSNTPTAFAAEPTHASARAQLPPLPIATRAPERLAAPQQKNRTHRPAWLPVVLMAVIVGAVLSVIAGGKAPAHADEAASSARLAAAPLSPKHALDKSPLPPMAVRSHLALAGANTPRPLHPTSAPAVGQSATTQSVPLSGTPAPTGRPRLPKAQQPVGPRDYGI